MDRNAKCILKTMILLYKQASFALPFKCVGLQLPQFPGSMSAHLEFTGLEKNELALSESLPVGNEDVTVIFQ